MTGLRLFGTRLLVEYVEPPKQSQGGIWLPDTSRENQVLARVLAAGPGFRAESGARSVMYCEPGSVILADKRYFVAVDKTTAHIREEEVAAQVMMEGGQPVLIPQNEYLLVDRDEPESVTPGGIVLPQTVRRRARRGVILEAGPGKLRQAGDLQGTRLTCCAIMGLTDDICLQDRIIHWPLGVDALEVVSNGRAAWLVPASAVLAFEETGQ
jgi:co-chaperonin GroES (HSP10)